MYCGSSIPANSTAPGIPTSSIGSINSDFEVNPGTFRQSTRADPGSFLMPFVPRRADSQLLCFFEPRFAKSDVRKNCLYQNLAKSLICKGLILRTRDFARSQEVENRERERAGNAESQSKWGHCKSARKSEKPRQAWGPTGLVKGKERLFTEG